MSKDEKQRWTVTTKLHSAVRVKNCICEVLCSRPASGLMSPEYWLYENRHLLRVILKILVKWSAFLVVPVVLTVVSINNVIFFKPKTYLLQLSNKLPKAITYLLKLSN